MISCEKKGTGYEIMVHGEAKRVMGELASLAAAMHLKVMREDLHVDMNKDAGAAVRASCMAFSLIMEETMERMLDTGLCRITDLPVDRKGGAVQ